MLFHIQCTCKMHAHDRPDTLCTELRYVVWRHTLCMNGSWVTGFCRNWVFWVGVRRANLCFFFAWRKRFYWILLKYQSLFYISCTKIVILAISIIRYSPCLSYCKSHEKQNVYLDERSILNRTVVPKRSILPILSVVTWLFVHAIQQDRTHAILHLLVVEGVNLSALTVNAREEL